MENNELRERIRKNVKEKIAVSNIRKEFDMKESNRRKLIYGITSSAAVVVLGIGIIVGTGTLNSTDKPFMENIEIADLQSNKENREESLAKEININKLDKMAMMSLDADIKTLNNINILYFEYLKYLKIPDDFDNKEDMKAIYTRSDVTKDNYDTLNNYVFSYRNTKNNRNIILAFSDKYKPLRDYYIENKNKKVSKIGNAELYISQSEKMYIVEFEYKGVKFDIETIDISEDELVSLLESLITGLDEYNNKQNISSSIDEDKDVGVKEQVVETTKFEYPEYYGGRYVEKGKNVILLCEDNSNNRKDICKILGITESYTEFKYAKYSYNYLTDLQTKISQAMTNKELTFVTSSALKDDTNNIVITVKSNNSNDIEKLKKFDTIGGALEIIYSDSSQDKEDLAVFE